MVIWVLSYLEDVAKRDGEAYWRGAARVETKQLVRGSILQQPVGAWGYAPTPVEVMRVIR